MEPSSYSTICLSEARIFCVLSGYCELLVYRHLKIHVSRWNRSKAICLRNQSAEYCLGRVVGNLLFMVWLASFKVTCSKINNLMACSRNKITFARAAYLIATYFLFGAMILLCIQARISKAIPREGPLQHLSSATKMIHHRSVWVDEFEQAEEVAVEPCLNQWGFPAADSDVLPALPTLTVEKRYPWRTTYYLRPPPTRL